MVTSRAARTADVAARLTVVQLRALVYCGRRVLSRVFASRATAHDERGESHFRPISFICLSSLADKTPIVVGFAAAATG